jgi:glycosyltransferase involved in cell wall biosynthesis
MRQRVYLAIDCFGWAFDNIAQQLKKNLSDEFEFVIVTYPELIQSGGECDCVVAFWWNSLPALMQRVKAKSFVLCLYDHVSWAPVDCSLKLAKLLGDPRVNRAIVSNNKFNLNHFAERPPVWVCQDGVDTSLFVHNELPKTFLAGWCGNTQGVKNPNTQDLKGLKIITEACNKAGVPLVIQNSSQGHIPHDRMVDWYKGISVYMCASSCEGTPNPVLEAMACGRPVISTDVGIVDQLIPAYASTGIIVNRSVDDFVLALEEMKLLDLRRMGYRAREISLKHDWKIRCEDWRMALR